MKLGKDNQSKASPRRRSQLEAESRASLSDLDYRYTFKRNRTLTGSASSSVSSAAEKTNSQIKSPRLHGHDLRRKRKKLGTILLVILIIAASLYYLLTQIIVSPRLAFESTENVVTQQMPDYEKRIDSYLNQRPAERFKFSLNQPAMTKFVQAEFPEVQNIEIADRSGIGQYTFTVTPRQPVVSWTIAGSRYFVDRYGFAFSKNYYKAPAVEVVDESGIKVPSGQAIASNRLLGFIGQVVGASQQKGLEVDKMIIPFSTTRQVQVVLKDRGYPIKMSVDRPVGEQVEDMERAVGYVDKNGLKVTYLDIRVSGKAFYK